MKMLGLEYPSVIRLDALWAHSLLHGRRAEDNLSAGLEFHPWRRTAGDQNYSKAFGWMCYPSRVLQDISRSRTVSRGRHAGYSWALTRQHPSSVSRRIVLIHLFIPSFKEIFCCSWMLSNCPIKVVVRLLLSFQYQSAATNDKPGQN